MKVFSINLSPLLIAAMSLLICLASFLFLFGSARGYLPMLSEKDLVVSWQELSSGDNQPVYYLNYLPVSARFYTSGKAHMTDGGGTGLPSGTFWLAAHKDLTEISYWDCHLRFEPKRGLFNLYSCER